MLTMFAAPISTPFLWDRLIPVMFESILGSPLLVGGFVMMTLYLMSLALRLSFEIQLVSMFFAAFVILWAYIPAVGMVLFLGVGIFIGMFLIYNLLGR